MQSIETFKTIAKSNTAEYKSKGSRFIAIAYPIDNSKQVKEIQARLVKEHFKARHVCYAYRFGADGAQYRANDDNEPSGSAGLSILAQIDSFRLTDIVVMVVRYFGGTLLGVPGLIKAYKMATQEVLSQAKIIEKKVYKKVLLECTYPELHEVRRMIQHTQAEIIQQNLYLDCKLIVNIPLAEYNKFLNYFRHHMTVKIGEQA